MVRVEPRRGSPSRSTAPGVSLLRSSERALTHKPGVETRHSFSFGRHYRPDNLGFGRLCADNEEWLAPGAGYPPHEHRDVEIVSWVVSGRLRHVDSLGHDDVIGPGTLQRLTAGAGVVHSESNAGPQATDPAEAEPSRLHYVQSWLSTDGSAAEPGYDRVDVGDRLAREGLVEVLGSDGAALRSPCPGAAMWVARLPRDASRSLPAAPLVHLHVVRGALDVSNVGELHAGDTARLRSMAATTARARSDCEVVIWCLPAEAAG